MPSWKKVIISGSSPTFNNVTTSGNVSGSSTSVATFGSYGGNVSGSSISTGSFGLVLGDGSALTGISAAGGSSIFAKTGSYYSAYSDLQVTGSLSVLGTISGSLSGMSVGQKYQHSQTVAATTWTISHNFDYQYPNIDVYDGNDQIVIPTSITATDSNTITLIFGSPVSGNAIISTGGQAISERGKNVIHNQSTPSANWRVTHSIGEQYPAVTVYDSDDNVIIPQQINAANGSQMDIVFSEAVSGNANITVGGGVVSGTLTGSAQVVESLPSGTVSSSAQIASDISGSFTAASSSFSTRVTQATASIAFATASISFATSSISALKTDSGSFSTRVTALKTDSGSFSTRATQATASISAATSSISALKTDSGSFSTRITADSSSLSTRVTTVEGSGTIQGVGTTDSPTFADITATGTVTAQEFHTEFVSASINYTSGSNKFGNSGDDEHQFTGSIQLSGSLENESYIIGQNVGIGTTDPSYPLHVQKNQNASTILEVQNTDTTNASSRAYLQTRSGTVLTSLFGIQNVGGYVGNISNHQLRFVINDDTKMTLATTGYLGIGITAPNHPIHINKSDSTAALVQFTNSTTGTEATDGAMIGIYATEEAWFSQRENNKLHLATQNTARLTVAGDGSYVEFPTANVKVSGSSSSTGSFGKITVSEMGNSDLTTVSSSISTRLTTEESNVDTLQSTMTSEQTNIDNLQTDSGSFSTRVTQATASISAATSSISALKTDSGSFSTRITNATASVAGLVTDSGSFSTRITTAESELGNTLISGSAQIASAISGSFTATSSSLSTRVTSNEGKATKGFTIAMSVAL